MTPVDEIARVARDAGWPDELVAGLCALLVRVRPQLKDPQNED